MILLLLTLVVVSVLLWFGPAPARQVIRRLSDDGTPQRRTGDARAPQRLRWSAAGAAGLLALWLLQRLVGSSAAAVGAAVLIVGATSARLSLAYSAGRRATAARVEVAHACSVLASQVRVGRVPAEALHGAADDCAVLATASRAQDLGGEVTKVWREQSRQPGHGGLSDLARAWQVCATTGAPLGHSLEQVSEALTADVAARAVIAGELAAPRATGKIMAVLPLCGLGMGYLIGGDPVTYLLSSTWGWGCLVVGVALASAGVLWIDKLARLADEQG